MRIKDYSQDIMFNEGAIYVLQRQQTSYSHHKVLNAKQGNGYKKDYSINISKLLCLSITLLMYSKSMKTSFTKVIHDKAKGCLLLQ